MATESELRLHRCCFTGHRPEKLTRPERKILIELEDTIRKAVAEGYVTYITGMARGVDLWAAEIVLKIRTEGQPIHLICAIPHLGFENRWSLDWQQRYRDICAQADLVRIISKKYDPDAYQRRNQWMVDHSARVIAVFNGRSGGTQNTINYAMRQDIAVLIIRG